MAERLSGIAGFSGDIFDQRGRQAIRSFGETDACPARHGVACGSGVGLEAELQKELKGRDVT